MVNRPKPGLDLLVAAALALLAGCAGSPYRHDDEPRSAPVPRGTPARPLGAARSTATAGRSIAELATRMVGVPYRYGGTSPREGFDCSGLVFYAYSRNGFDVPRNSRQLFRATRKIPVDRAAEGDLVFFQDQQKLSHVGIYLGGGLFVHAPSSGRTVSVSSLDNGYYRRHLVGVGRLLPD